MALDHGSHIYGQGLDRLARLVELSRDASTPARFTIVGHGPVRAVLETLVEGRLHMLGPQLRERKLKLFAAADLLVLSIPPLTATAIRTIATGPTGLTTQQSNRLCFV